MRTASKVISAALALACSAGPARAQGIPVIDFANLIQTLLQVANDIAKINNQIRQILQLEAQTSSINGTRGLGQIANNPLLSNYVPAQAYTVVNAVNTAGYAGLQPTAKSLRDEFLIYNCMDLTGAARVTCQSALAQPYQHKGLLQDAMKAASRRLGQINTQMNQVNATTDQKSVLEIQARLSAENALLAHEATQLQMLQGLADSEERIARSRDRERQHQMLGRTGRISDFLP